MNLTIVLLSLLLNGSVYAETLKASEVSENDTNILNIMTPEESKSDTNVLNLMTQYEFKILHKKRNDKFYNGEFANTYNYIFIR